MEKRMCIYVSSPKSYKDVFDAFYICKNRFWPDSRYRFVLSTNYEANYKGVDIIDSHNTSDTWVERSMYALSEINEKYIMLLCDDLLISKKIDSRYIDDINIKKPDIKNAVKDDRAIKKRTKLKNGPNLESNLYGK